MINWWGKSWHFCGNWTGKHTCQPSTKEQAEKGHTKSPLATWPTVRLKERLYTGSRGALSTSSMHHNIQHFYHKFYESQCSTFLWQILYCIAMFNKLWQTLCITVSNISMTNSLHHKNNKMQWICQKHISADKNLKVICVRKISLVYGY